MSAATSSSAPSTVNPTQLSLPELNQHKQRLEQEVGQLTDTLTKLRVAQQAYDMSARALGGVSADKDEGKETLVPLSNSVYVRGKACEVDRVLLNVGTGYFVEKPTAAAQKHCEDRSGMINGNIGSLAKERSGFKHELRNSGTERKKNQQSSFEEEELGGRFQNFDGRYHACRICHGYLCGAEVLPVRREVKCVFRIGCNKKNLICKNEDGEKRQNLEMCMAVMQQKMAAQQQQQQQQPAQ